MVGNIEVIGIDHGWSTMKTNSQVFATGVKEIANRLLFFAHFTGGMYGTEKKTYFERWSTAFFG